MKRRPRIGIYNPYLDTMGGGEKDICVMAEALSERYDVELISIKSVPREELEKRFNVNLGRISFRVEPFYHDFFYSWIGLRLATNLYYYWKVSSRYDFFINLVNFAPYPSFARKGIARVQFPFNERAFFKSLKSYDAFLANSDYTKRWTKVRWGVDAEVIYPPVEMFTPGKKENVILSVGRFFHGGHGKKHHFMISVFKRLCDEGLKGWEYHLIGSGMRGREHQEYLDSVKEAAEGYPVFLHVDAPFTTLKEYYAKSKVFIHSTGYGEDENVNPERFEHFGITTVEAMSAGCVPVVINGGGQREIIAHGENGYLWSTEEELVGFCRKVIHGEGVYDLLSRAALKSSAEYSIGKFRERILEMAGRFLGSDDNK